MSHSALSSEDQNLIHRIQAKINDGKSITYMQEKHGISACVVPSLSQTEIESTENKLAFKLPPLIREIYLQVGNGGFGAGYGIVSLDDKSATYDASFVESVEMLPKYSSYLRDTVEDALKFRHHSEQDEQYYQHKKLAYDSWQKDGIFAFYCHWGCAIWNLVDCSQDELPVYHLYDDVLSPHSSKTLRQWWHDWLDGTIQME